MSNKNTNRLRHVLTVVGGCSIALGACAQVQVGIGATTSAFLNFSNCDKEREDDWCYFLVNEATAWSVFGNVSLNLSSSNGSRLMLEGGYSQRSVTFESKNGSKYGSTKLDERLDWQALTGALELRFQLSVRPFVFGTMGLSAELPVQAESVTSSYKYSTSGFPPSEYGGPVHRDSARDELRPELFSFRSGIAFMVPVAPRHSFCLETGLDLALNDRMTRSDGRWMPRGGYVKMAYVFGRRTKAEAQPGS